jgi:hypothetical protein
MRIPFVDDNFADLAVLPEVLLPPQYLRMQRRRDNEYDYKCDVHILQVATTRS